VFESKKLINLEVFTTTIGSVDNEKILDELNRHGSSVDKKYIDSYLDGNNHTYYEDKKFPKSSPECLRLRDEIESTVSGFLGKKMKITEIWSVTLNKGESVSAHSHRSNAHMDPSEYYSIAYYPSAPVDCSKLIFDVSWCNAIENLVRITPITGILVLFNSYIKHFTDRHQIDASRVVVSANLCPEEPNKTPMPDWSGYD
jgi:hypothetical protein